MGGFTRFSRRWDFARFLPHMYSFIYNEGWCHSILLLKSNLKTLFKVHLSLFWCSQVVCLIPPEAGEIVLEMFFSQHSWSALCLSYAYKHSSLIAYSVSLESLGMVVIPIHVVRLHGNMVAACISPKTWSFPCQPGC